MQGSVRWAKPTNATGVPAPADGSGLGDGAADLFQICFFSVIFVLNPHFNFLETTLYYIVFIILLI